MNKLLIAAVYGAIVAVALAWHYGLLISVCLAPVGASLLTLLVAATAADEQDANPARHDLGAFTSVDRT